MPEFENGLKFPCGCIATPTRKVKSCNRHPEVPMRPLVGDWPAGVHRTFVEGVRWWEYEQTGATLWASDRRRAEEEAVRRYGPVINDQPHPWYGDCDGFGPAGECPECAKDRFKSREEWEAWLSSKSRGLLERRSKVQYPNWISRKLRHLMFRRRR